MAGRRIRVGISLGPKFGAITMAQVSDALRDAIGYDLVVFAGFAVFLWYRLCKDAWEKERELAEGVADGRTAPHRDRIHSRRT